MESEKKNIVQGARARRKMGEEWKNFCFAVGEIKPEVEAPKN